MNHALLKLLQNDFQLQWRYRIIAAYAVVIALYTAIIAFLGGAVPKWIIALIIYSDPAVLGFFFLGGLMMLEKSENVRTALAMSPLSTTQYLGSKAISLTALALVAVTVLSLAAQLPLYSIAQVLLVTACVSVTFVAIGAVAALKFKTVSGYLIGSIPIIVPLIAPAALLLIDPLPLVVYAIPPVAQLMLLTSIFEQALVPQPIVAVCYISCVLAAGVSFMVAAHILKQELGAK